MEPLKTDLNLQSESKLASNALRWIISVFQKHHVDYQITGGLAAKIYGATRPLVDIDIDLSNESIKIIMDDIKPFLIYGPTRYQDEQWDILLLTLDYDGQLIDISGADDGLIYDKAKKEWVKCNVNFSIAIKKYVDDIPVSIINKNDLIKYKSELKRDIDLIDLAAITNNPR